jgi:preprotein translocase subunit SecA
MLGFVKNIFAGRKLTALRRRVAAITMLEPEVQKLSAEELKQESEKLKSSAQGGTPLDELLPRAFALVREAARRTLGQRPYDVQLMGGIVLHEGGIAEMMTGEGKTLAAVAPAYLNALAGKGVHVVTVNEYLARRDAVWMGQIYRALGLSVACLVPNTAYLYDPDYVRGPRGQEADNADSDGKLLHEDLTYKIRGAIFAARKAVGLGHKEVIYQNVLAEEFKKLGLAVEREKVLDVVHDGKKVGVYRPDFVIDGKVILEVKSLPFLGKVEKNQILTYLKGSEYKVALLVNFGGKDIEIKRVVFDEIRDGSPRRSAPSALLDRERDTTGGFMVQQEFLRPISRREAYLVDITYGTNHEFGFDYLRDNLAYSLDQQVQQRRIAGDGQRLSASYPRRSAFAYAIIDEVDSILIDEARTPLIIAAPDAESSEFYKTFSHVVRDLQLGTHYTVDEKFRAVHITNEGIERVEKMLGVQDLYGPKNLRLVHYLEESLKAKALFHRDKDYVVKDGEIVLVDEFTGRLLHGRRYSGGLHQAIEAKEGVVVQQESKTYARVSIQNYFRLYKKLAGMTGTAQTSAEEFHKVYGMEVVSIPPNKPCVRKDEADFIYKTAAARWGAVVRDIKEAHERGQPVLVGTTSIAKNELLDALLSKARIPHEVLNAKNNEREGAIIAQAGKPGAVTVATNMAGRGVDIILGGNPPDSAESAKVRNVGGLYVVGTERHEARRIDNQLRGRSGRQGDPGFSRFYLSLEDDLLRVFGGEMIRNLMTRFDLPEDQPIEAGIVTKAVAQAQAKVEGANFDMRKHLLEYDDVLNKQRTAVYKRRQEILESVNVNGDSLRALVSESAIAHAKMLVPPGLAEDAEFSDEVKEAIKKAFEEAGFSSTDASSVISSKYLKEYLSARSADAVNDPQTAVRVLSILDLLWMNHLEDIEALMESIGLRAYAQRDPLVEYRHEAHRLFRDFWTNFDAWVFLNIFRLAEKSRTGADKTQTVAEGNQRLSASVPPLSASSGKVGRNDPCPCGAKHADGRPKKYKHCHGR